MENHFSTLEEMFDAIRDENGVLHPSQFISKPGQRFTRLWDGKEFSLEELRDSLYTNT